MEDQYPRIYQVSLSGLTVIKFFYQPNTTCTKFWNVVFHCGMFEVKVVNNMCIIKRNFPSRIWKGLVIFLYWFHASILIGYPVSSFASLTAFIPSAGIITLVSRVMKCAFSPQKGLPTHSNDPMASLIPAKSLYCLMLAVHDTCEKRTWLPIICPTVYPACGPLQIMQSSSSFGHCVSAKPITPPSHRTAIHALGHGQGQRTHLQFCDLMCRWTYPRHLPEVSDMYGGLPIGIIVIVIVEVIHRQTAPSSNMYVCCCYFSKIILF